MSRAIGTLFYQGKSKDLLYIARDQSPLARALNALQRRSLLVSDPFVALGLKETKDILLIEPHGFCENSVSSSQYDSKQNTIYINKKDLEDYGLVVLFHLLIQSGLMNSVRTRLISKLDHKKIVRINQTYFGHFKGCVGCLGSGGLANGIAFAIGYTYQVMSVQVKLEKRHLFRRQMYRFIDDVWSNPVVSQRTLRNGRVENIHLITSEVSSKSVRSIYASYEGTLFVGRSPRLKTEVDAIKYFVRAFCSPDSLVFHLIKKVGEQIKQGKVIQDKKMEILLRLKKLGDFVGKNELQNAV